MSVIVRENKKKVRRRSLVSVVTIVVNVGAGGNVRTRRFCVSGSDREHGRAAKKRNPG
jgi:hypothetical protein